MLHSGRGFFPSFPYKTLTRSHTCVYSAFFSSPAEQSDKNSALIKQEMLALQAMLNTLDYKRKVRDMFCGPFAFSPYSHAKYSNPYMCLFRFSSQNNK